MRKFICVASLTIIPTLAVAEIAATCEPYRFENMKEIEDLYISSAPKCMESGDYEHNNYCGYLKSAILLYVREKKEIQDSHCDFSAYTQSPHFYTMTSKVQKFLEGISYTSTPE